MPYINTTTMQYPVSEQDIRNEFPDTSFPTPFVPPEQYQWVFPSPKMDCDEIREYCTETTPVLNALGKYEQAWQVVSHTPEEIARREAEEAARPAKLRNEKIQRLKQICGEKLDPYSNTYPRSEVDSWAQQVKEAEAFTLNPAAPTPMLSGIASMRGTTVAHLVTRVFVKANAYAAVAGEMIGYRQYLEDQLLAASTTEQINAINIETGWPT